MVATNSGPKTVEIVGPDGVAIAVLRIELTGPPDLALVDALARLQLAASRAGCTIRLRNACADMCALIELVGLGDVIASAGDPAR